MTKIKKSETNKKTDQKSVQLIVAKNHELESMLKRTLADYQNLERRIEEERKQLAKLSALLLIEKLLPILDNLENAQAHLSDEGLAMVIKQFRDTLSSEGVEEISAEGQEFNPNFHDAVEIQRADGDNKIVKVVTKGYKIEDKVIRPAKVVVTKKSAGQKSDQPEEVNEVSEYA